MTSKTVLQLSPTETYEFVLEALHCRQVAYISGPPAIGKSQIVHQIADDIGMKMIDLRLSQMLPEDLTGLPERDPLRLLKDGTPDPNQNQKARYLPFDTFPMIGDEVPAGYNGWILFLDELSSASEEVLAAAYSLILDHRVGGHDLHPKCLVVAAGNRSTDSAIARPLPDTLITRMLPIEMRSNVKSWLAWATRDDVNSHEAVVNFITKHPAMLFDTLNPKDRQEMEPYATPRGWEKVFKHVIRHETKNGTTTKDNQLGGAEGSSLGVPLSETTFRLIAAAVGMTAARSFREDYDEAIALPTPWEVAQSPSATRIPQTTIARTRLTTELAKYFLEAQEQSRDNVLTYMNRIGGENSALFVELMKEKLGSTPSDLRLLENISKRLQVSSIPNMGGGASEDPDDNFPSYF